ncbi:MAG: hypothetical protein C0407_04675 [Desulfobacca sp.]|nr:hypothetical protein [Desulfobacca sp.]
MTAEKVTTDFFASVNSRDLNQLADLLTENARLFFPKTQPIQGKDRILKFLRILFRQYPELTFQIHRIIIQENQVAVHWQNRGIIRKSEPYENEGVTWFEFIDGHIDFISDFFKDTEKF